MPLQVVVTRRVNEFCDPPPLTYRVVCNYIFDVVDDRYVTLQTLFLDLVIVSFLNCLPPRHSLPHGDGSKFNDVFTSNKLITQFAVFKTLRKSLGRRLLRVRKSAFRMKLYRVYWFCKKCHSTNILILSKTKKKM